MGINYIGNDTVGRECHAMRKTFDLNLAKAEQNSLKRDLYTSLNALGLGREILIIGQKI